MEEISKDKMPEGDLEVQVSVTGEVYGSDQDGNPVKQTITEDALKKIADDLNASEKKVLVDRDHGSSRAGLDRDTRAVGWLSNFWTTAKGLFAKMFLTPFGKQLVEGREYRYLSPTFTVDENGVPLTLEAAGAVNTPAMETIKPLINSKPVNEEKLIMEITKEELVELIKSTVTALNTKPAEEPVEETKAEVENACGEETEEKAVNEEPAEETKTEETKTETVEEPVEETKTEEKTEIENGCGEEVKNACGEEKPVNEEPDDDPEEEKEVIKIEALNQKPVTVDVTPAWQNLHGQAFWDYLSKHPDVR